LTVVVDDSFQYGQNKEKTNRWLAYHDKSMKAYQVSNDSAQSTSPRDSEDADQFAQWRFVASAKQKFGDKLANFAGGFLKTYIMIDISALSAFLGDPLRNF
jgi:hypothetical protein